MPSSEEKARGFTISDRRQAGGSDDPPPPKSESDDVALPPVELHTFLLSLGSSALMHLGEIEGPNGADARRSLPMAKHTIDVLAMLQIKTRGNLTPPEEQLLESLLYDLRLRYVEAAKKG